LSALVSRHYTSAIRVEYTYCEEMIATMPAFIDSFVLYFHQIYHIDTSNRGTDKKIKKTFREVEQILSLLTDSISDIKDNFDQSSTILLHIKSVLKSIKARAQQLSKEMNYLSNSTNYEEYMRAFNDCFKAINKDVEKNEKGELVRKMISLVKDSCMNQLYLETMLDIPCKVAHQLNKNRGMHMGNIDTLPKQTVLKYLGMMEKPEFIKTALMEEVDLKEFFEVVRILLQQTHIVNQIRETKPYLPFFDKYVFTTNEFSKIYFSWKNNLIEIAEIEKNPQYLKELEQMKNFYFFDQTSNSIFELGKFTKKLWEYQQKVIMYHSYVQNMNMFRKEIQEICIGNFNMLIDIIIRGSTDGKG
jgi:hypothetical protein